MVGRAKGKHIDQEVETYLDTSLGNFDRDRDGTCW